MNKLHFVVSALLLSSAACAAPATGEAGTSTSNIEGDEAAAAEEADPDAVAMEVEDLDGDDVPETFTSRRELCGTGGCQWTIHLSKLGAGGEVFAKFINPRPRGSETIATSFYAYQRGGHCYGTFQLMDWNGSAYEELGTGMDCNEIIKRPEGAPIAQFEAMCFSVIPPECKDMP